MTTVTGKGRTEPILIFTQLNARPLVDVVLTSDECDRNIQPFKTTMLDVQRKSSPDLTIYIPF